MEYKNKEVASFTIVDDYLTKLNTENLPILDIKNKPAQYLQALNLIIENELIVQGKNNKYGISEIGKQVLNNGGIEKNLSYLTSIKDLKDDVRLKKIQLDIGKHIESRNFNIKLIIISVLLLLFLIIIKFFYF